MQLKEKGLGEECRGLLCRGEHAVVARTRFRGPQSDLLRYLGGVQKEQLRG
jgi:hypothetical protein